jgi:hypothetical protein
VRAARAEGRDSLGGIARSSLGRPRRRRRARRWSMLAPLASRAQRRPGGGAHGLRDGPSASLRALGKTCGTRDPRRRAHARSDADPGRWCVGGRAVELSVRLRGGCARGRRPRLLRRRRWIRWTCRSRRRRSRGGSRGSRRGRRIRCGRRLGRGWRGGSATRRKEAERVDVGLGGADPNAEVHVRHLVLGLSGRASCCEHIAFRDRLTPADTQLAEMREGRLVLARGDGDREAVGRDRPGERHGAGQGRTDRCRPVQCDVDAAVLTSRVSVAAHGEAAQDGTIGGPSPCPPRRAGRKRRDDGGAETGEPSRCPGSEHEADGSESLRERQRKVADLLQRAPIELVARQPGHTGDDVCGRPPRGA